MADRIGQQLGNYRLLRMLGRGGFAEVYLAEHVYLKRRVALKVLHTSLEDEDVDQFLSEAQTLARLEHPNIVRVFDFAVEQGTPFLAMDYAPRGTLRKLHPRGSCLSLITTVAYVKQVADALHYAHSHRVIHRDVKPQNMLLGRRQEVLLSDFGLATLAHSSASVRTQEAIGTPSYMAPEQIEGHPRAASDQYALGVVVYEWLCGSRPFEGSATEVMVQQLTTPPPPLHEQVATIPLGIEQVVLRALAKDPKARFSTVQDFAEALEQASQRALSPTAQLASEQAARSPAAATGYDTGTVALGEVSVPKTKESAEPPSTVGELERRLVTVLFCDLAGFTSLSEQLDPEDMHEILGMYFGRISQEIGQFGGTVEKYAGDAVLALFGIPVAHEDDAERAIRCGLSMQSAFEPLATEVRHRWGVELALRVGVNTGEVMSGIREVGGRKDYAISGDMVNTAAQLQAAAEEGEVLVGEETRWLARRAIRFGARREVALKGKAGVVPAYAALGMRERFVEWGERGPRTPLVDRTDELALLTSFWAKVAREKRFHLVTVLGEPGIGKSRLVAEFEKSLLHEARVLHGRCLPYGEVLGYWALAEVVKEAAGITVADERKTASRKLGDLVANVIGQTEVAWDPAEITRHLALLSGLDVDGVQSGALPVQRDLHMSMRRFLEALARSQPLIVLLEDLHWADDALLDLTEFIAARVHDVPLLIVVQARPELLEKRPTWGRGVRGFTSLSLEPLDERYEQDLLLQLCHEHGLPEKVTEQIGRGAAGNPLFAEELVATIAERGRAKGIPSAIKALIAARLDALPTEERRTLQLAAVIGKVFWVGGLRALGAAGNVIDHLEELEQKDLLRSQLRSQFRGDREYAFKHDLIRDVAYEMLARADRRWLHSRVVEWIELISGERVEEYLDLLAHHAVQANQPDRAIDYLTRAATRADRAAAHREEAALLAQAIEIAERTGRQPLSAELRAKRGRAFRAVAMWTEADQELKTALAGLAPAEREQRLQVLIDLAEVRYWLSDTPGMRQYASEALGLAEQVGREDLAGSAMGTLALADASEGSVQTGLDHYRRALIRADKNHLTHLFWFEQYGLTLYWTGDYEAAIERCREVIKIARKSHDTTTVARALGNLGLALTGRGRYDEALAVLSEARQFAREYGTGTWLARSTTMIGNLHLELFDFARAEALAEEAREISRSLNWPLATASGGIDLLFNYARRQEVGRTESLLVEVAEAVAGIQRAHSAHTWLWKLRLAAARAEIALARGEWEAAIGFADDAIAQSLLLGRVKYRATGLVTRAKALAALRRTHEAIADLNKAVELMRSIGDPIILLRAAAALLNIDGDEALLAEAHTAAQRIIAALSDEALIRCFKAAEPVIALGTLNE